LFQLLDLGDVQANIRTTIFQGNKRSLSRKV
jgi:hypothetical protein